MVIARAPVRISFAGGGTDLAAYYDRFGGLVVSAAVTRYCYVCAREPDDGRISINSADYRVAESYARGEIPLADGPLALPRAAIAHFAPGLRERGVDLFLASEVPPGSGLGSSSAMATALVSALAAYTGRPVSTDAAADLACLLEIERLGLPIGKQDQYASAYGGLNTIAFSADGVTVTPLDLPDETLAALNARLLLFATGRTRHSASILGQQRADTAGNPVVVEALHRVKDLAEQARAALRAGELDRFGALLDRGWQEKKKLSRRVSDDEIDTWYAAAREAGALGGKITGAGGGGFLLLYCPLHRQKAVRDVMAARGLSELTFDIDLHGVQTTLLHRPEMNVQRVFLDTAAPASLHPS